MKAEHPADTMPAMKKNRPAVDDSEPCPLSAGSARSGSALLITLLMVGLLLVVVLAFVAFVRIEFREVENRHQIAKARASARLGMNLAIGQLQHLAGPDQRITARSDLFTGSTDNVYKGDTVNASPEKSKWVGVWDSTSFQETYPEIKEFLGWLVSGSNADVEELTTVNGGFAAVRDLVTLVGANTAARPEDRVRAPKIPAGTGQNLAWWVKDENLAARFDAVDPYRNSSDPVERQFSLHSAQRYGVERMRNNDTEVLGEDLYPYGHPTFTNLIKRLVSLEQVPLIWKNQPDNLETYKELIRHRYHDLSLVSRGVLADVRNGGLRQDLSMAFEMPYAEWVESEFVNASPNAEVPLYQPPGYPRNRKIAPMIRIADFSVYGFTPESSKKPFEDPPIPYDAPPPERLATDKSARAKPVLRGPSWDLFRNYYRLYKSEDPDLEEYGFSSTLNLQADGTLRARSPFPHALGYGWARRYGGDPLVWDYAERVGGTGMKTTRSLPIGRAVLPGVSPVVVRLQTLISYRSRKAHVPESGPALYELDLYIDPVVTIWNPYNIRLKTGSDYGQPLVLGLRFFDPTPHIEARPSGGEPERVMSTPLEYLLRHYVASESEYDSGHEIIYHVEMDLGKRVMEPGEVVVFSHAGPAVPYSRNESQDPNDPDYTTSGMLLNLTPGVDRLPYDSGMVLDNVLPHFDNSPPEGRLPSGTELRFKMTGTGFHGKYRVEGFGKAGSQPFMSSFTTGVRFMNTSWSPDSYKVQELVNPKQPATFFDSYLKHADSSEPINLAAHYNPRAQSFEQGNTLNVQSSAYQGTAEDWWWGEGVGVNGGMDNMIDMSGDNGFWGPDNESMGFGDWNTHIPMYDIPRAPMTSMANLQHVPMTVMGDEPSFVVGNSLASVFVGYSPLSLQKHRPAFLQNGIGRATGRQDWTLTRVDWSYLMNKLMFDGYYFSGVAPGRGYPSARAQLEDHILDGAPLPNSQFHFRPAGREDPAVVVERLFDSGGAPALNSHREISSHFMVNGMFNINSTSVEAWKALLASTRKLKVETQMDGEVDSSGSVYTRMSVPSHGENKEWTGFRSLTDAQIGNLAAEIVRQVRERGPFLNLADFVNRRAADRPDPSSVHPHMRTGALQAAIDAAGLNDDYVEATLAEKGLSAGKSELNPWVRNRVDRNSKVAMGVTGYLTQADLLSVIGPLLSARSDTFTIRSYGEVVDATGRVVSRAWCEAVVQRVPDYQDSTRARNQPAAWRPHETPSPATRYDAATPRRKFEIVRFRWLNPEEI